eukprot:GFUD01038554.1.p1 GENE.GFUD01038554.1~~GFUD01038554.1.p1  ORF type:complete len:232 (+),score=76.80 GFUD01038554.1:82-777(+)
MGDQNAMPVLGYWDIRGLAAPIRLLLEYTGADYENRVMIMAKPEWLEYKQTLGFDFPNLPYYQEGDLKLTQSSAILRHLARRSNLLGKTEQEGARADMLADVIGDFRGSLVTLCYNQEFNGEMLGQWISGSGPFQGAPLKKRLENLQSFLISGKGSWCAGENLTFVDFLVWEALDQHRLLVPGCMEGFDALNQFMVKFEELENIKKYLTAPGYKKFPIWSCRAKYGYFPLE